MEHVHDIQISPVWQYTSQHTPIRMSLSQNKTKKKAMLHMERSSKQFGEDIGHHVKGRDPVLMNEMVTYVDMLHSVGTAVRSDLQRGLVIRTDREWARNRKFLKTEKHSHPKQLLQDMSETHRHRFLFGSRPSHKATIEEHCITRYTLPVTLIRCPISMNKSQIRVNNSVRTNFILLVTTPIFERPIHCGI
ncbi:hypothetical protein ARMGADRAFT_1038764 [Armillaria gallica]|uniref:Uncharacterized protein n=1 Tax=Armillaria gallica TaxID=47427 RepID=A0A2H3D486_ARMGA|nr:hypothetical protein ARMGADRAFT_1038764 [Armillaria gallica]